MLEIFSNFRQICKNKYPQEYLWKGKDFFFKKNKNKN